MRVKGGEFAAGPYLRWADGKLVANNHKNVSLASVPAGEWCRIEIQATTGAGKYNVRLTRANGTSAEINDIPCLASWNEASYLLFSGIGEAQAAFYIDNVNLLPTSLPAGGK
jgi:hypothetical protein